MSAPSASGAESAGQLYVVATPIGNLGDVTLRAVETLRAVNLIVAEDTRHSRTLLEHLGLSTPMSSYHAHNEARETPRLVRRMLDGESVALISDAGTPLLSDPGARLVTAAIEAGVHVVPIPGASALLAALVASGLSSEQFTFLGFLPRKGGDRDRAMRAITRSPFTTILYESPQRIASTLDDLIREGAGARRAALARELTKRFEEVRRGTVTELREGLTDGVKGEIVLLIDGAVAIAPSGDDAREVVARMRSEGASSRDIIIRLTDEMGVPRNVAYKLAHSPPESPPEPASPR